MLSRKLHACRNTFSHPCRQHLQEHDTDGGITGKSRNSSKKARTLLHIIVPFRISITITAQKNLVLAVLLDGFD